MVALRDVMTNDVSSVFMNPNDFAGTVMLLRGGDANSRTPITAVVAFKDSTLEKERGRGEQTKADMVLAAEHCIREDDAIEINGIRFEVVAITPQEFGAQHVELCRYKSKYRGGRTVRDL